MKLRLLLFFLILSTCVYAQKLDPYIFFPANVGDRWEYTRAGPDQFYSIAKDSIDTIDSSRIIFYDSWTTYNPIKSQYPLYGIDKNYNVFYDPLRDNRHFYKLDSQVGDSWIVRIEDCNAAKVLDIFEAYIFGKQTTVKTIGFYTLAPGDTTINENSRLDYWEKLAYGFGLISREDGATEPMLLRGCRINGITYGTVGIDEERQSIPSEFILHQNYPNPFNPTTVISYRLPEDAEVTLKVNDVLGREVAELINTHHESGSYEIPFDGSNLPSGVYFYNLTANGKSLTKKMTLIK